MLPDLKDLFKSINISDSTPLFNDSAKRAEFLALVRKSYSYQNYYPNVALRELLFDLIPYNEAIPIGIRDLLGKGKRDTPPRSKFIEEWLQDGLWPQPETEVVELSSFLDFIRDAEKITRRFSERNLHNSAYFYSKLMEWFLSCKEIEANERATIADIGSAYFGFGAIAESLPSIEQIYLIDLGYPQGSAPLTEKVTQIGANASDLPFLENGSIDLVTLHNAIEHFSNDADSQCLKEISRLLKPGGKAIISPLFFEGKFSISLNPVSAFYFLEDEELATFILNQAETRDAVVRLSRTMLSPYAHIYDYSTLKEILLDQNSDLIPRLRKIEVTQPEEGAVNPPEVFGVPCDSSVFTKRTFYTLELLKPLMSEEPESRP